MAFDVSHSGRYVCCTASLQIAGYCDTDPVIMHLLYGFLFCFEIGSYCVAKDGFKFMVLLPQHCKFWDKRCKLACMFLYLLK